jgi:uncharacterized radical SAM superfamily Fe-S cluster-containing enzyme
VILVPTVVPGVNTDDLGAIVAYALERAPTVRGVHFQPVSYFGRYPSPPSDLDRITIPEVMSALERQTGGAVRVSHLRPPSAENAYCSFQGNFVRRPDGSLTALVDAGSGGCCPSAGGEAADRSACCEPHRPDDGARRARESVARRWAYPGEATSPASTSDGAAARDSLDAFLEDARKNSFSISGMAFQDAWNIDLERLRDCFLHVAGATEIVPFCAYNLTDVSGRSLYRRHL